MFCHYSSIAAKLLTVKLPHRIGFHEKRLPRPREVAESPSLEAFKTR